jgi:serine/threonine protein kinase
MEYDKFGNLRNFQRNYLKRNILSEQLICYISYCILNGLKYIHMCNIAHMDLKPQNITVDDYFCFKIIDFSISIDYSKIDEIKLPTIGTNFYMSPEVLSNKTIKAKDLNKVDLYSLGVILYNLAFGYYPYNLSHEESEDYDKIAVKINSNWEIKNEDNTYSELFIDFLKKLLEKDIDKRMNINQALNHTWAKGAKILLDEKEKVFQCSNFLLYLLTDHFKSFNDYVKK